MKRSIFSLPFILWALVASAAPPVDFSGAWSLNASKSQNLGMMARMEYSLVITQNPTALVVKDRTKMMGEPQTHETQYALNGTSTANVNFMGDKAQTVTRWDGARLVTTWTSSGAVAGTTMVRTETRALSPDGKTMTVESTNGAKPPIVFVFDRK